MTSTFTTGVMGAGKSRTLIEKFKKDDTSRVALAADLIEKTGNLGEIKSRNGQSIFAFNLNALEHEEVIKYVEGIFKDPNLETAYIDEVQFLDKLTVSKILNLSIEHEIDIHFFGLSTAFTTDYFDASKFLLNAISPDKIEQIPMDCQSDGCTNKAEYNARIVDGEVARQGKTMVAEKSVYLSICKKHYFL